VDQVVVEFTAKLNVEKSVFLAEMQTSYKQGVADVSKVDVSQVTITSVTETRRRAGSIEVATSVSAPASSGGEALKQNLASVSPAELSSKIAEKISKTSHTCFSCSHSSSVYMTHSAVHPVA
jgi:hypothetical protein